MTQSPSALPSKVTTLRKAGSSSRRARTFSICASSSAKSTWLSESARMYTTSFSPVDG